MIGSSYAPKIRKETEPCIDCGREIGPGWAYLVGPPPRHIVCPTAGRFGFRRPIPRAQERADEEVPSY